MSNEMFSVKIYSNNQTYTAKTPEGHEYLFPYGYDVAKAIKMVSSKNGLSLNDTTKVMFQGDISEVMDFDGEELSENMTFEVVKKSSNG